MAASLRLLTLALLSLVPTTLAAPSGKGLPPLDASAFNPLDIIDKDVAIVGGGSSGTYAAIKLKDAGKSVVVIEKQGRLGGHTETYTDPTTGTGIDMGVIFYHNNPIVRDYFDRFKIPLELVTPGASDPGSSQTYDFRTGKEVTGPPPNATATQEALQRYAAQLANYPYLARGYFLPDEVPEELWQPFGQFVEKHDLGAAVGLFFAYPGNMGDILRVPAVYMLEVFGPDLLKSLQTGFYTTARHNNSEIYGAAQTELLNAKSLFLNSEVLLSSRPAAPGKPVQLLVNTTTGLKLIRAKKLLITIPPTIPNITPLDISATEAFILGRLDAYGYYTGILNNTGIPNDLSVNNRASDTPYNLPHLPAALSLGATIAGANNSSPLKQVFYGTQLNQIETDDQAKSHIIETVKRLQAANPGKFQDTTPTWEAFHAHSPFNLQVSGKEIRDGFYQRFYGLQGERNTWWAGATWKSQDSTMVWQHFGEEILPGLLGSL
jgi:hypothetical protein